MADRIDTGDYVHHGPTGEDWVVAYVRGDRLAWQGWPPGEAALADCTLLQKASPAKRHHDLLMMAECGDPEKSAYAKHRLAEERNALSGGNVP